MNAHGARLALGLILFGAFVICVDCITSQEALPPPRGDQPPAQQGDPAIPKGVDVQGRGPIHEAFASPTTEPKQPYLIPKKPPLPIEELPPEEKPDGDVAWIGGYYSWDDDRQDFMWVSGCWRVKPTGKEWVPGYWREVGENWQWVSGFWTGAQIEILRPGQPPVEKAQPVTYYPEPPEAPKNLAPPGDPPRADMIYVPGSYVWVGDRYVWRAGTWVVGRADYVYVPGHYRWTPYGYVYVPGYWDLAVAQRGVLYTPVTVDVVVVGRGWRYTPCYAVRDTIVLDALFVRPGFGIYYFGDYYGPRYVTVGFEPGFYYARRYYDPLIVHERWVYRDNPRWFADRVALVELRVGGRAALPPRRFEVGRPHPGIASARAVMAAHGMRSVRLSEAARAQVHRESIARHEAMSTERRRTESAAGHPNAPRASSFNPHETAGAARPGVGPEVKDAKGPGGPHDPLKGGKTGPASKKDEKRKDR